MDKNSLEKVYETCRKMDFLSDENKPLTELISNEHDKEKIDMEMAFKVMMLERKMAQMEKVWYPKIRIVITHSIDNRCKSYVIDVRSTMTLKEVADMIAKKRSKDYNVPIQKVKMSWIYDLVVTDLTDLTTRLADLKTDKGLITQIHHKWETEK